MLPRSFHNGRKKFELCWKKKPIFDGSNGVSYLDGRAKTQVSFNKK